MKNVKMYCNISCIDWGITGSPVILLDTNKNDWNEIEKIITENALKFPNAKFIINPVVIK